MASSSNNHPPIPIPLNSNSKNPNPSSTPSIIDTIEMADPTGDSSPVIIDPDSAFNNSEFLTQQELLSRRSRKLHQLAHIYKDHYWTLMEELKNQYREYSWDYGKSPFVEDVEVENLDDENDGGGGGGDDVDVAAANVDVDVDIDDDDGGDKLGKAVAMSDRCEVQGCKMKAMPLTKYCHMHILRDENQVLYKGCNYAIKSSQAGPILCGRPILRVAYPSLCIPHLQKAEKHIARALRRCGLSGPSTSKLASNMHVVVAEFVNHMKEKRRATREAKESTEVNEGEDSNL